MRRDLFDAIFEEPEGQIFLLNLAFSREENLVEQSDLDEFRRKLEALIDRSALRWWLRALPAHLAASRTPDATPRHRFNTVVALPRDDAERLDPLVMLYGGAYAPADAVRDDVIRGVLAMKSRKKIYWLSEARSTCRARSADDLRDLLGLDWVDDDMSVFRVDLDHTKFSRASIRRPSGLCGGSARFKALRHDRTRSARYTNWGRTLDLRAWRRHRTAVAFRSTGAAEVVAQIGPMTIDAGTWHFVGTTKSTSTCNDRADHECYVKALAGGLEPDADNLHKRLS